MEATIKTNFMRWGVVFIFKNYSYDTLYFNTEVERELYISFVQKVDCSHILGVFRFFLDDDSLEIFKNNNV